MLSSSVIVGVVIAFVAVAFLCEALRKDNEYEVVEEESERETENDLLTADQANPTDTGLFRAQELLKKAQPLVDKDEPEKTPKEVEEEALPDPFDNEPAWKKS